MEGTKGSKYPMDRTLGQDYEAEPKLEGQRRMPKVNRVTSVFGYKHSARYCRKRENPEPQNKQPNGIGLPRSQENCTILNSHRGLRSGTW